QMGPTRSLARAAATPPPAADQSSAGRSIAAGALGTGRRGGEQAVPRTAAAPGAAGSFPARLVRGGFLHDEGSMRAMLRPLLWLAPLALALPGRMPAAPGDAGAAAAARAAEGVPMAPGASGAGVEGVGGVGAPTDEEARSLITAAR